MKKIFLVIGMGTFGLQTAKALYEGGASVLAVDSDPHHIETISGSVTRAVCADATNEEALGAIGAFDADVAIVALRRHFDTTVLVTHLLRNRGVPQILAQVDSEKEGEAIRAVGASSVIFPERDMAERIAQKLLVPDLVDQIPLGDGVGIVEVEAPPSYEGHTLAELGIRRNHGVTVIAVKSSGAAGTGGQRVEVAPAPDQALKRGDVLVMIGRSQRLAEFKEAVQREAKAQ